MRGNLILVVSVLAAASAVGETCKNPHPTLSMGPLVATECKKAKLIDPATKETHSDKRVDLRRITARCNSDGSVFESIDTQPYRQFTVAKDGVVDLSDLGPGRYELSSFAPPKRFVATVDIPTTPLKECVQEVAMPARGAVHVGKPHTSGN